MTSKLKCPVCKKPLEQVGTSRQYQCGSWGCDASFDMIGTESLWAAWTQAKQDLEIARKAMNQVMSMGAKNNVCYHIKAKTVKSILGNALEQIEHKDVK